MIDDDLAPQDIEQCAGCGQLYRRTDLAPIDTPRGAAYICADCADDGAML